MPRVIDAICIGIGLVALAVGASVALRPADVPPQFQLAQLQQLAESSCQCERRAGKDGATKCWAEFERRMPGTDWDSTCEPSIHTRCVGEGVLGGNDCVTMQYYFGGHLLCSRAEVSAMEAVFYAELAATGGSGPAPKTEKLYRDIIAGKPLPKLNRSGLCLSS